jgi:hypothetical protein
MSKNVKQNRPPENMTAIEQKVRSITILIICLTILHNEGINKWENINFNVDKQGPGC